METENAPILLVEDSPDDVFFMRYALKKAGIVHRVHVAEDGQQAVDYLGGRGKYSDRAAFPLPAVIFLDLKLPGMGGFDVLAWMREQPAVSGLPVFVLTGSAEERDKQRARELGARAYFVKPPHETMLREAMQSIKSTTPLAPDSSAD